MAGEKRLVDVMPFMKTGWHLVRTGKSNEHLASMSLADVPTVDAVEVVHGQWLKVKDGFDIDRGWKCSRCNNYVYAMTYEPYEYCPHCGAMMDGERKKNG